MSIRKQLLSSFTERRHSFDFWAHVVLYTCMVFAFWPITQWFASTANDQSRILHALIVLALATAMLLRFGQVTIQNPLEFTTSARRYLICAYALLFLGFAAGQATTLLPAERQTVAFNSLSILSIPAYGCGVISLALFVFGHGAKRVAVTVGGTLTAFLLLSILMEPLDWPLRGLAGQWSGAVLGLLGKEVQMGLMQGEEQLPMLILLVNQHPFHVASECNGFGVILTSLLVAFLLGLYRRLGLLDLLLNIAAGIFIGFIFNILRIVIIVLLAPSLMNHYLLMHEIVGGITYWGCLLLVWVLLNGPIRDEPET